MKKIFVVRHKYPYQMENAIKQQSAKKAIMTIWTKFKGIFFESRLYTVTVFVYRSSNYYQEAWQIEIVSHIDVNCKGPNYLTNVLILWQTNASFNRHISGAMEQILTGRKLILISSKDLVSVCAVCTPRFSDIPLPPHSITRH